jgi:hypothetical protein
MDALNVAVGLMAIVLGFFSIGLAVHFYEKAKDAEKETAIALASIRTQGDSLQKLTARWMDRFTRHATEPRPADEGLMALVSVVADLPTAILTTMRVSPGPDTAQVEPLYGEVVSCYVALYYYTGVANVSLQISLPAAGDYDETNEAHAMVRRLVDSTAADFAHMAGILNRVDPSRIAQSAYPHLLADARDNWRPYVRTADQAFRSQSGDPGNPTG